eukprot:TRINITY_DN33454_c0_g1_i1.p1 TRINITY_DN33454_c0_g1~~TRINITY_DN33454_c0_g1_i1.p1  ORF type:complete len:787 (+),score=197.12 TRINITY_DN33454_c0_g1_i1:104-2464(+)
MEEEFAVPAPATVEQSELVHTVGVFLEEVAYFLDDMKRDLWWLLVRAHQPGDTAHPLVRGDEELLPVLPAVEAAIGRLMKRAADHAEAHAQQVRAKIVIIPGVTTEERSVLSALSNLTFHCKGKIEVFPCMKEANNAAIWGAYHNCVAAAEPQWLLQTDSPGQKNAFAQCIIVVPVWVDPAKQEIKLLNVFCPEKKKRNWAFMGGDIVRGTDRNLFDSARREFHEEVGVFFGWTWEECFQTVLPTQWCDPAEVPNTLLYAALEKEGVRYQCRPHLFAQVTESFYENIRCYEDSNGVIRMPQPSVDFVRWDELHEGEDSEMLAQRVHLDGVAFLEHDEARWVSLEFDTGKLSAGDNRPLRRETAELFKQRPEKIWGYFAALLGVQAPGRQSALPQDYPEDGPLAIRMSGIDKSAQDSDIVDFFAEVQVTAVSVRQYDVPRHTARVDFADKEALEGALAMNGRALLRRKVKVELWCEGDGAVVDAAPGAKPMKEYDGELPEEGPWHARCRGLDRSVTRSDLGYFFWDRNCAVADVLFPIKAERHAGLVEFADVDSLRRALSLNNAFFRGRALGIELSSEKEMKAEAAAAARATGGGGAGGGFGGGGGGRDRDRDARKGERSGKGGGKSGGYDREPPSRAEFGSSAGAGTKSSGFGGGSSREPPSRAEFGGERPKLNIKPRSSADAPGAPSGGGGRSDPFGAAGAGGGRSGGSDPFGAAGAGGGRSSGRTDPFGAAGGAGGRSDPFGGAGGGRGDRDRGGGRPDPFGGARPRDDNRRHARADDDDNWRR